MPCPTFGTRAPQAPLPPTKTGRWPLRGRRRPGRKVVPICAAVAVQVGKLYRRTHRTGARNGIGRPLCQNLVQFLLQMRILAGKFGQGKQAVPVAQVTACTKQRQNRQYDTDHPALAFHGFIVPQMCFFS